MVGSCRETCESERLSSAGTTFQALKLRWNCEVDCGQLCGLLSRTEISRSYQVGLHELAFACEVAVNASIRRIHIQVCRSGEEN